MNVYVATQDLTPKGEPPRLYVGKLHTAKPKIVT
jgi:hypothetical protein